MPYGKEDILAYLKSLNIAFELYEHPACFTVEESQVHCAHIPGVHVKNLFLKDQKTDALFLATVPDERVVDLKALPEKVGAKKFSFGKPDLLMDILGVAPGSVTPLGLYNDVNRKVQPVLDEWMMQQPVIACHPLINTATVTMKSADLLAFMKGMGYQPQLLKLDTALAA
jgi:Ala-tRNA(Pro) deacylase